jgi:hypothetical protein
MKLTKINYNSAMFFGVIAFLMYLSVGVFQWMIRDELFATYGLEVTLLSAFVVAPVVGGIAGYLGMFLTIAIYNLVARKYPISWEVSKK